MRFIIILALFSVTAYASSDGVCEFHTAELPNGEVLKEVTGGQSDPIAYNFGIDKAACTLSACYNYCNSVMYPPFLYACCADCCVCIKL